MLVEQSERNAMPADVPVDEYTNRMEGEYAVYESVVFDATIRQTAHAWLVEDRPAGYVERAETLAEAFRLAEAIKAGVRRGIQLTASASVAAFAKRKAVAA